MNVLLIDNESQHTKKLVTLLENNSCTVVTETYNILNPLKNAYDLIVLSGSSHTVAGNEGVFKKERTLIRTSTIPIIGICFGFELIASAYGIKLSKLPEKRRGIYQINLSTKHDFLGGFETIQVFEAHRYHIPEVSPPLVELAHSGDGVEIFMHESRPIYGFQFHPEVHKQEQGGDTILENLIKKIASQAKSNAASR